VAPARHPETMTQSTRYGMSRDLCASPLREIPARGSRVEVQITSPIGRRAGSGPPLEVSKQVNVLVGDVWRWGGRGEEEEGRGRRESGGLYIISGGKGDVIGGGGRVSKWVLCFNWEARFCVASVRLGKSLGLG